MSKSPFLIKHYWTIEIQAELWYHPGDRFQNQVYSFVSFFLWLRLFCNLSALRLLFFSILVPYDNSSAPWSNLQFFPCDSVPIFVLFPFPTSKSLQWCCLFRFLSFNWKLLSWRTSLFLRFKFSHLSSRLCVHSPQFRFHSPQSQILFSQPWISYRVF